MEQKTTVMIVEDNALNLKLAKDLLEIEGFDVCACTDAESALDALKNIRPALILMDVALPGMDGLELTRRLKADEKNKAIKIIALTAFAMAQDKDKAMGAGCDGYITKPINTREFARQIFEQINQTYAATKNSDS